MTAASTTTGPRADDATPDLAEALRRAGIADVDDSGLARALYSSDASLYRVLPRAVVRPRHVDEMVATLEVCRSLGVPLTARGAGTSIAGNAVGPGVVLDTSRYLSRVLEVDAEARTATVEPGVVQASLQTAAQPHGLRFGPDPSTHNRCTIGGMIGNNACGSRALGYGRTSDNVVGLDVVTGAGRAAAPAAGRPPGRRRPRRAARRWSRASWRTIRTELGRFGRQVSGYSLEHLLPERGFDVARALVGSEGTLAIVLGATVRLVADAPFRGPGRARLPDDGRRRRRDPGPAPARPDRRRGARRPDRAAAARRPGRGRARPAPGRRLADRRADRRQRGRGRAQGRAGRARRRRGAGLARRHRRRPRRRRSGGSARTAPGWPPAPATAARRTPAGRTPPSRRSGWAPTCASSTRCSTEHGLQGVPYGHFGDGCVHVRIDFPFGARAATAGAPVPGLRRGRRPAGRRLRRLAVGRARRRPGPQRAAAAHVLPRRDRPVRAGQGAARPGRRAQPRRPGAPGPARRRRPRGRRAASSASGLALAYRHDGGDFSAAVHRCTGVGKCRADLPRRRRHVPVVAGHPGGEGHHPRPRAGAAGDARARRAGVAAGARRRCTTPWTSACPARAARATARPASTWRPTRPRCCTSPTGAGCGPGSHYTLGRLPFWADLAARAPRLVNRGARLAARRPAGQVVGRHGPAPRGAARSPGAPSAASGPTDRCRPADGAPVALWVDSFTDHFAPQVALAAARVLEAAGYRVQVPGDDTCCGLTWITTGQLDARPADPRAARSRRWSPLVDAGIPIVGVEPSCTAVLRGEALELVGGADGRAGRRAAPGRWPSCSPRTPGLGAAGPAGLEVVAQPHCHHASVLGLVGRRRAAAEGRRPGHPARRLLRAGRQLGRGARPPRRVGGHRRAAAAARRARTSAPDAVVLADGFSCRTQLDQLAGRRGLHLAELLAARLP